MFLKSINLYCTFFTECILTPLILKKIHEALWPTKWGNQNVMEEWPRLKVSILFQGKPNEKNNTL